MKRKFKKIEVEKPSKLNLDNDSWVLIYPFLKEKIKLDKESYLTIWETCPEERGQVKIMGKKIDVPRFQKAFGTNGYYFSGMVHKAEAIQNDFLLEILKWVNQHALKHEFVKNREATDILMNWYPNGDSYIGPHSDNENQIVENSPIYSFSFGQNRTFKIEPKDKNDKRGWKIPMPNNSLLIMGGKMQKHFKHSVPKEKNVDESRINITVRFFK